MSKSPPAQSPAETADEAAPVVESPATVEAAVEEVMQPTGPRIELDRFSGPFEVLLYLIKSQEIDIFDIPIVKVTEQYLQFLEQMREENLDVAGDFLVMAATLIQIKSKMILPVDVPEEEEEEVEEEDPRLDLVEKLLEYRKFRDLARLLGDRAEIAENCFARRVKPKIEAVEEAEEVDLEVSLYDLSKAIRSVLRFLTEKTAHEIIGEGSSVDEKIAFIEDLLESQDTVEWRELFENCANRIEIVCCLLAILELCRMRRIRAHQHRTYGNIRIFARKPEDDAAPLTATEPAIAYETPTVAIAELPVSAGSAPGEDAEDPPADASSNDDEEPSDDEIDDDDEDEFDDEDEEGEDDEGWEEGDEEDEEENEGGDEQDMHDEDIAPDSEETLEPTPLVGRAEARTHAFSTAEVPGPPPPRNWLRQIGAALATRIRRLIARGVLPLLSGKRPLSLGPWGESVAARHLRRQGYKILERNVRLGRNEIDIIAQDRDTIVFVEVRTRGTLDDIPPEDSITEAKQRRLRQAARHYIARRGAMETYYRFDAVSVIRSGRGKPELRHFRDAFH